MRIKTQFILTMVLFGIALAVISASALTTYRQLEQADRQENLAASVAQGASELSYLSNDYVIYREMQQLSRWQSKYVALSAEIDNLNVDLPEQQALVRNIKTNQERLKEVFDSIVATVGSAPQGPIDLPLLQVSWSRIAVQSQGLVSDATRLSQSLREQADGLRQTNLVVVLVMLTIFGAYYIVNFLMVQRRILKSLATLQHGTTIVGSGNLEYRLEAKARDEIGDLSRAFNRMTSDLGKVTASKNDLELEVAERRKAEQQAARRKLIQEGINRILDAYLKCATHEEMTLHCLKVAEELTQSKIGFIGEIGPDGMLHDTAMSEMGWESCDMQDKTGHRRPPGSFKVHGLYGWVLKEGKSLLTNDPSAHPDHIGTPAGHPVLKAFLGVPLLHGGKTIGLIAVGNREGGYRAEDLEAVEALAPAIVETTMRKRTEQRASEQAAMLASVHDAVIGHDKDLRVTYWNEGAERLYGYAAEEVAGQVMAEVLKPVYAGASREELLARLYREGHIEMESMRTTKEGRQVHVETHTFMLLDDKGAPTGSVSIDRDITERKLAEKELTKQALMLASVHDPITSHDMDYHITYWNQAAERLYGYTAEEAMGQVMGNLLKTSYIGTTFDDVIAQLQKEGHVESESLRTSKDGRQYHIEAHSILLRDDAGKPIGLVSIDRDITERKRAERQIVHLASFPELNPNPVLEIDEAGNVVYANPGARSAFPDLNELGSRHSLLAGLGSLPKDEMSPVVRDVPVGGRWYLRTVAYASSTQTFRVYGRDITERKKVEDALRESEEKYRSLFENMLNGFAYCRMVLEPDKSPDFVYLSVNRAFETLTGLKNVVGKRVSEVIPGIQESNRELLETYSRVAMTGTPAQMETYLPSLDMWLSISVYSPGKEHFVAVFDVITERKKAEGALRESEEKYRGLFNNMAEEVRYWKLERDEEGRIKTWRLVDANPQTLRTWGKKTVEEVKGKTPDEIFSPGSREQYIGNVEKIMAGDGPFSYEDYLPNLDRYLRYTSVPIGDHFITTGMDLTEMKKAEQSLRRYASELEAVNKELEAFSYSVSHDLRAPLRSMEGFSSALLEDYEAKLDDQGKQYLKAIQDSSELMGRLIDDLLKLSRITRSEMTMEKVNLSDLARSVVADLQSAEPKRKVKVTIAPDLIAKGDRNLVRLALQNLVGNAWKFTGKVASARIEVGVTEREGKRAFFVRDNGAGFDMAYADKLFKPFQRLHGAKEFSGTGIGLATVHRVVRRHGGQIWAESAVGKGATFYFTLG